MRVEIIRKNYAIDTVDANALGGLIESNSILAFQRSYGWVVIGRDPIRVKYCSDFLKDRRQSTDGIA